MNVGVLTNVWLIHLLSIFANQNEDLRINPDEAMVGCETTRFLRDFG